MPVRRPSSLTFGDIGETTTDPTGFMIDRSLVRRFVLIGRSWEEGPYCWNRGFDMVVTSGVAMVKETLSNRRLGVLIGLALLAGGLASCGATTRLTVGTQPGINKTSPSVVTSGSNQQADFATLANGGNVVWLRTQQDHLYFSSDGGSTLREVTPPSWPRPATTANSPGNSPSQAATCGVGFPASASATPIWLAQSTCGGRIFVAHTEDQGQSWKVSTLPQQFDPQLTASAAVSFLSADEAWVSVSYGHVGVSARTSVYRTTDGGNTWVADATVPEAGPARFVTPALGFAIPEDDRNVIMRTADGGKSFQAVALPLPSGFNSAEASVQGAPQFVDSQHGVLPVHFTNPMSTGAGTSVADVTADGGNTWIQMALPYGAYSLAVVTARDWVVVGGGISGADFVAHTKNAGRSWSTIKPNQKITGIQNLQFITDDIGVGVVTSLRCTPSSAPAPPPCPPQSNVLRTTDGGANWHVITLPSAVP